MGELIQKFVHSKSEAAILARTIFEFTVGFMGQQAVSLCSLIPISAEARVMLAGFISIATTGLLTWLRSRTSAGDQT